MNSINGAIGFGISGFIFLLAGILAINPIRHTKHPRPWIVIALACFVQAILAGYTGYQNLWANVPSSEIDILTIILMVFGSGMALAGILFLSRITVNETQDNQAIFLELERYRSGFDKVPFMIIIKDNQGNYLYTNPVYQYFLGKKGQNLIGESDFKFYPRAQAITIRQEEEKVLESGIPAMKDEEIRGVDGIRWIRFSRIPLKDRASGKQTLLVSGQDISRQKQIEFENHDIKGTLDDLSEILPDLRLAADRSSLLENAVKWSAQLANTAQVGIWQMNPENSTATLKYGTGKLSQLLGTKIRTGRDLPWKVWQNGQPLVVENYQNWADRTSWIQDGEFSTALGIPLNGTPHSNYVLTLFTEKNVKGFGNEQVIFLKILTNYVASQLDVYERIESSEVEIREWQLKLDKTQFKNRLEHILAVIASFFINMEIEKVDEAIIRALETIIKVIGVDRGYLVLFPNALGNDDEISFFVPKNQKYTDLVDATRVEFQNILNKLNQLDTIYIPQVSSQSLEGEDDTRGYLQEKGIKSYIAIPLISNRSLVGYLGFEALKQEVNWSKDIPGLLKTNGEMFVNLLDRQHSVKASSEELKRAQAQVLELTDKTYENAIITEMGDLLQACRISDEAYPIIIRYMQKLIPACSGALYIIHSAKDPAENVAAWGNEPPGPAEHELAVNECWALRRGRLYSIVDPEVEPVCNHIKETLHSGYMCVPLVAQGEMIGVLHLRMPSEMGKLGFDSEQQTFANKISEYIAMPLTNLKLRDELRSQAIRDPLTKLFNRRYMEETLEREIRRANRHSISVGIIMFDIDKMKPINDQFGHDAGDVVLRTLGRELMGLFRGEDVPCRYGGDEFTIVLPEANLADVWRRAEQMREAIKRLDLKYDGKQIGPLTVSIGVAAYPDHGTSAERVLLACDAASYASKAEGGDRIMLGHKAEA